MSPSYLDEILRPSAILTNSERVASLRAVLAIMGEPCAPARSHPNTPGEVAELEARLSRALAERRAPCPSTRAS